MHFRYLDGVAWKNVSQCSAEEYLAEPPLSQMLPSDVPKEEGQQQHERQLAFAPLEPLVQLVTEQHFGDSERVLGAEPAREVVQW